MTWHTYWNTLALMSHPAPGLACRHHNLPLGGDVDNAALGRLATDGKIADLIWEAPEDLTAEHSQAFQAAMQAHHTGHSKLAEQHWQQFQAIWSRAWAANYAALELLQNTGITTFHRSSRNAGSSPPSSITAAPTASRIRMSTTSSSPG